MKAKEFDELIESVREGGRILRGEAKPSREFTFTPEDVQAIRKKLSKSQDEFALMIGVSVATLRNWDRADVTHTVQQRHSSRSPLRTRRLSRRPWAVISCRP